MNNKIVTLLKVAVPVAIIAWLLVDLQRNHPTTFRQLQSQSKDWPQLILGLTLCFGAISLTIFRWYCLVRGLGIPFEVRDAVRLGFLGYVLNFVVLGSVGGDLFKGLFLAREQPDHRVEAIATIVVDRVIGMYGLLLVASAAIMLTDLSNSGSDIRFIASSTLMLTCVSSAACLVALLPGFPEVKIVAYLERLPKVGRLVERLISALQMYRRQKGLLLGVVAVSVMVHTTLTLAVYCGARSMFADVPTRRDHFIISPLANVVGALPISPSGLGTFELAMQYLYDHVPADDVGQGKGLVVALCYRLLQIGVAGVGVGFYWFNRRQVAEILRESKQWEPEGSPAHVDRLEPANQKSGGQHEPHN